MNNRAHTLRLLLVLVLVLVNTTSCAKPSVEEFQPRYWPTQGWNITLPEEQGADSATLLRMFEYIEQNSISLHSLLIVRNGYLVMEAYWHPYGPNDRHSVESITKAVVGTLVGIAVDHSEIKDTEQRLVDFFLIELSRIWIEIKRQSCLAICFR